MQVTTEDGGRLNAFAKEPRMEVIDAGSSRGPGTQLMLISGAVLDGLQAELVASGVDAGADENPAAELVVAPADEAAAAPVEAAPVAEEAAPEKTEDAGTASA